MFVQGIFPKWRSSFQSMFSLLLLVIAFPLLTSCENRKIIVNALEEKEANEIIVFLSGKGIDANKIEETTAGGGGTAKVSLYDIDVPDTQATEALAILNQAGLPRRASRNLLQIFSGSGLVPSDLEQKIRYEAGLAEQIASTIRKIDGVIDAEVQLSFPQEDPLNPGQYKGKITASVFVKHNGILDDPNSHLISKIKRFVASSVTGLNYDDVTVIPVRAQMNEIPSGVLGGAAEEEKQYVNVWGITVAKDSVTKFRAIFLTFAGLLLLILLTLIWMLWKLIPLLGKYGGFKELLHLHPIKFEPKTPEEEAAAAEKDAAAKASAKKPEEEHEKDVDIT
jgi:type III secretion protein J